MITLSLEVVFPDFLHLDVLHISEHDTWMFFLIGLYLFLCKLANECFC